jgi:hypothetical protein
MLTRSLLKLFCFITLLSCSNHELSTEPMAIACEKCGKSRSEMQWLETLLEKIKTDPASRGDLYAVPFEGRTIILQQPIIMSCVACVLYDCDGNRIDNTTLDIQEFMKGMNQSTRIYSTYPD